MVSRRSVALASLIRLPIFLSIFRVRLCPYSPNMVAMAAAFTERRAGKTDFACLCWFLLLNTTTPISWWKREVADCSLRCPAAVCCCRKRLERSRMGGETRRKVDSLPYQILNRWVEQGIPLGSELDPIIELSSESKCCPPSE